MKTSEIIISANNIREEVKDSILEVLKSHGSNEPELHFGLILEKVVSLLKKDISDL